MFAQRSDRRGGEVHNIFHMTFIHLHSELTEEHKKTGLQDRYSDLNNPLDRKQL